MALLLVAGPAQAHALHAECKLKGDTLTVDGTTLPAVASLGTNPTFVENGGLVLEVHVLDWDGDLYDKHTRTTFVSRIRDEAKFDSVDALVDQIRRDIDAARRIFA